MLRSYSFYKVLAGVLLTMSLIYHCLDPTVAASVVQRIISVTLYNSYTGSLRRSSVNPGVTSGGMFWSSGNNVVIDISATTGSIYIVTGSSGIISGSGVGSYTHSYPIDTTSFSDLLLYQGYFERGYEPYTASSLALMIDRNAPSMVVTQRPVENTTIDSSNAMYLQWSPSIDTGVGIARYRIHLSLHPSFTSDTIITTPATILQLGSDTLPVGTLYRYVEAVDYLGNVSTSLPSYFHYNAIVKELITGSVGGGPTDLRVDTCPKGDYSSSYYDGVCYSLSEIGKVVVTLDSTPTHDFVSQGSGYSVKDILYLDTNTSYVDTNTKHFNYIVHSGVTVDSKVIKKTLVEGYAIAQRTYYIDNSFQLDLKTKDIAKVHHSPYIYRNFLQTYHLGSDKVVPMGYGVIYISWIMVLLLGIKSLLKSGLKFDK